MNGTLIKNKVIQINANFKQIYLTVSSTPLFKIYFFKFQTVFIKTQLIQTSLKAIELLMNKVYDIFFKFNEILKIL
jgi:hypothetical protein